MHILYISSPILHPRICEPLRYIWFEFFNPTIAQSKGIIKHWLEKRVNVERKCWKKHTLVCTNYPSGRTNLFRVWILMDDTLSLFLSSLPNDCFVFSQTFVSKSCFPSETIGLLRKGMMTISIFSHSILHNGLLSQCSVNICWLSEQLKDTQFRRVQSQDGFFGKVI